MAVFVQDLCILPFETFIHPKYESTVYYRIIKRPASVGIAASWMIQQYLRDSARPKRLARYITRAWKVAGQLWVTAAPAAFHDAMKAIHIRKIPLAG